MRLAALPAAVLALLFLAAPARAATSAQVDAAYAAEVAAHPSLVSRTVYGTSRGGRPLTAYRVGTAAAGSKPAVLYVAAQNGEDEIAAGVQQRLFAHVVANAGGSLASILAGAELWFVPIADPDGYDAAGSNVAFDRNWDYRWGYDREGASDTPGAANYRGTSARSEPEVAALSTLLDSVRPRHLLDYRAGDDGRILYPESWQIQTPATDAPALAALAGDHADPAIAGYVPGPAGERSIANGTLIDTVVQALRHAGLHRAGPGRPASKPPSSPTGSSSRSTSAARRTRPSQPDSHLGNTAPDFVPQTFTVSYGSPQTIEVNARRALGTVSVHWLVNGHERSKDGARVRRRRPLRRARRRLSPPARHDRGLRRRRHRRGLVRGRRRDLRSVHLHRGGHDPGRRARARRRGLLRHPPRPGPPRPRVPRGLHGRAERPRRLLRRLRRRRPRPRRPGPARRALALPHGHLVHGRRRLRARPRAARQPGHEQAVRRGDPRRARPPQRRRPAARHGPAGAPGRVGAADLRPVQRLLRRATTCRDCRDRRPLRARRRRLPAVLPRRLVRRPRRGGPAAARRRRSRSASRTSGARRATSRRRACSPRARSRSSPPSATRASTARRTSSPPSGTHYAYAASQDEGYQRLTRTIDLTSATSGSLKFKLSYDTDPSYDFVFVEAREAGQSDWTTLADAQRPHERRHRLLVLGRLGRSSTRTSRTTRTARPAPRPARAAPGTPRPATPAASSSGTSTSRRGPASRSRSRSPTRRTGPPAASASTSTTRSRPATAT